jgi:hypothetical protein
MRLRLSVHSFLVIALCLATDFPAAAQQRNMRNPGMMPMTSRPIKGTLISATANQVQMANDAKQTIYAMVGPNTKVSVTGTAEREYLKAGMSVEFVANVAKGGAVKDKIDHLTLVTITSDRPAGLLPPEVGATEKKGSKGEQAEKGQRGGAGGAGGDAPAGNSRKSRGKRDADPLLGGDDLLNSKPSKTHGSAPQLPGTFTVRGTLKMCKNGAITVAAGRGPTVKAELADNATIDVDMTDLRAAQRDDPVTVNGVSNPTRPNMIMAESVTIELANPLTGKKHAKPSKTPPTRGKAKKDADTGDTLPDGK